jgi:hypothetical protein
MEQLGSHWMDFDKFDIWGPLENMTIKIQVWLKSDKNNGYFTWKTVHSILIAFPTAHFLIPSRSICKVSMLLLFMRKVEKLIPISF